MPTRIEHFVIAAVIAVAVANITLAPARGGEGSSVGDFHLRQAAQAPAEFYCGVESLYVCCRQANADFDIGLPALEQSTQRVRAGVSAEELVRVALSFEVPVDPVETSLDTLLYWGRPAVLHVNGSHYVALLGEDASRLVIFDPSHGLFDCTEAWFQERYDWRGTALVVGGIPAPWIRFIASFWFVPLSLASMSVLVMAGKKRSVDHTRAAIV